MLSVLLGYITAFVLGLDEGTRRAISIEVGMQNSGLGVALATAHFEPAAALPSVLAAVWHNIADFSNHLVKNAKDTFSDETLSVNIEK